jgi:glycosyltransferase involved in cell wall biosynthesis
MKLISVIENVADEYGGPSLSLPSLHFALNQIEVKNEIVTVDSTGKHQNSFIEKYCIDCKVFNLNGLRIFNYSRGLVKYLENLNEKEVIIYSNNTWNHSAYAAYKATNRENGIHIISPRGSLFEWSLSQSKLKKKLAWYIFQKNALNSANAIHVTSLDEYQAVRNLGIKTPVALIPHGIFPVELGVRSREEECESVSLDPAYKYVLFMSRLHKKKGLELLLSSWINLSRSFEGWKLIIAGPDYENYSKVISEASKACRENSVLILGMVKGAKKNALFSIADFFVLPSYSENFGVAIAEALSANLPVITTNNTPWAQLNDINAGFIIDADLSQLIFSMNKMMELDSADRRLMGENGRTEVELNYSWEASASSMKVLCEYLVGKGEKPDFLIID